MDILKGGGLILSGGLVAKLIDAVIAHRNARNQKTEIADQPITVKACEPSQTLTECRNLMANTFGRLTELEKMTAALHERVKDFDDIKRDLKELLRRTK